MACKIVAAGPTAANQLPFQIERTILHLKREYPCHDRTVHVTKCGRICIGNRKINLSTVFAGQTIGIREVADKIWLVSFMDYDPGFFDEDVGRVEPATNPFVPEL